MDIGASEGNLGHTCLGSPFARCNCTIIISKPSTSRALYCDVTSRKMACIRNFASHYITCTPSLQDSFDMLIETAGQEYNSRADFQISPLSPTQSRLFGETSLTSNGSKGPEAQRESSTEEYISRKLGNTKLSTYLSVVAQRSRLFCAEKWPHELPCSLL